MCAAESPNNTFADLGVTPDEAAAIRGTTWGMFGDRLDHYVGNYEVLSGSEWSEKYRVMPETAVYRSWENERTPYLREIADVITDEDLDHEVVIIMKPAQIGASEVLLNGILRYIDLAPCPILLYMENEAKAKSWFESRMKPALAQPPFAGNNAIRGRGNSCLFPGGYLQFFGVHSGASLSSTTAKVVYADEAARYPVSIAGEGDFLSLARGRTKAFPYSKVVLASTPLTDEIGEGEFITSYNRGDQREFFTPCHECDHYQIWDIENLHRLSDAEGDIGMKCIECGGYTMEGSQRDEAVSRGVWRPTAEPSQKGFTSYRVNGLAVKIEWQTWTKVLDSHAAALKGMESLQAFYNTILGLPFTEQEARVPQPGEVQKIMTTHKYPEKMVPPEVCFLTASIDVQLRFIDIEVKGWGPLWESWSIDRYQVPHNISEQNHICTQAIQELRNRDYRILTKGSEATMAMRVWVTCIDEGFQKSSVYKAIRPFDQYMPYLSKNVMVIPHGCVTPCKGANTPMADRLLMGVPGGITAGGKKRRFRNWMIGTDLVKRELYFALQSSHVIGGATPVGMPHAPPEREPSYYKELVAEHLRTERDKRTGRIGQVFYLPAQTANEALDLHVLNRVGAEIIGCGDWTPEEWESCRKTEMFSFMSQGKLTERQKANMEKKQEQRAVWEEKKRKQREKRRTRDFMG